MAPHPPTEMLLLFVRWLYGTPSPDTPPYGLLPNMSESSGTPGESPGFSRFILRGEPAKVDCTFAYRRGVSLHCAKLLTCNHGLLQSLCPSRLSQEKILENEFPFAAGKRRSAGPTC